MKVITTCKECGYLETTEYKRTIRGPKEVLFIANCNKYDIYIYTKTEYCIPDICLDDERLDIYKPRGIKWGTS